MFPPKVQPSELLLKIPDIQVRDIIPAQTQCGYGPDIPIAVRPCKGKRFCPAARGHLREGIGGSRENLPYEKIL